MFNECSVFSLFPLQLFLPSLSVNLGLMFGLSCHVPYVLLYFDGSWDMTDHLPFTWGLPQGGGRETGLGLGLGWESQIGSTRPCLRYKDRDPNWWNWICSQVQKVTSKPEQRVPRSLDGFKANISPCENICHWKRNMVWKGYWCISWLRLS